MGIIEVWTLVAVILHYSDVSKFATWPVIDWPWNWSCLCLEIWVFFLYFVFFVVYVLLLRSINKSRNIRILEQLESAGYTNEAQMLKENLKI